MENTEDTNEPTNDDVGAKEVDSETVDRKEESGEEEAVVVKKENKIEQRPFLTQSELLIKMKSGEEEEVKRCQIMIAAITETVRFVLKITKIPLSSGRIVCCLLANGVAIYCNRFFISILIQIPMVLSLNSDSDTLAFPGGQGLQARQIPDARSLSRPRPGGGAQILPSSVQVSILDDF